MSKITDTIAPIMSRSKNRLIKLDSEVEFDKNKMIDEIREMTFATVSIADPIKAIGKAVHLIIETGRGNLPDADKIRRISAMVAMSNTAYPTASTIYAGLNTGDTETSSEMKSTTFPTIPHKRATQKAIGGIASIGPRSFNRSITPIAVNAKTDITIYSKLKILPSVTIDNMFTML